jgi:hypothetical protein
LRTSEALVEAQPVLVAIRGDGLTIHELHHVKAVRPENAPSWRRAMWGCVAGEDLALAQKRASTASSPFRASAA